MNLQDIKYISAVAAEGSVNKAAQKLFVAQPSLSKCIRRVEQEYGVTLFGRSRGSALELTAEGRCFLDMAGEILSAHDRFEEKIRQLKFRNENNIVLGTTMQCAYDFTSPFLKWLYKNYNEYFLEIRTNKTVQLEAELMGGGIDMAMICSYEQRENLYYEPLFSSWQWIYLRKGSPASERAVRMDGIDYPVLRLEDMEGEEIVANVKGSSSRAIVERLMEQSGIHLNIIELSNWNNRLATVERGRASFFIQLKNGPSYTNLDQSLIYFLHPDQNVAGVTCLVCRQGFQKDPRFQAVLEGIRYLRSSGLF